MGIGHIHQIPHLAGCGKHENAEGKYVNQFPHLAPPFVLNVALNGIVRLTSAFVGPK